VARANSNPNNKQPIPGGQTGPSCSGSGHGARPRAEGLNSVEVGGRCCADEDRCYGALLLWGCGVGLRVAIAAAVELQYGCTIRMESNRKRQAPQPSPGISISPSAPVHHQSLTEHGRQGCFVGCRLGGAFIQAVEWFVAR
jgi:hypothetical protein